jgi:putative FmdB family regulatory protein
MPIYEYSCVACGKRASILYRSYASVEERPHCPHCEADGLRRVVSRPGLIRSVASASDAGELRAVEPRQALENLSRQYDRSGVDPGRGFEQVAQRAARGDSPVELKEAVAEVRRQTGAPSAPCGNDP